MTEDLPPASPEELDRLEAVLVGWLERQLAENPTVLAMERDVESGERLWMVRLAGDEKSVFTIWFHLRQRTLYAETYFCPAPLENPDQLYEFVLRRNMGLNGVAFAIGGEEAVYLVGRLGVRWIDETELDRILGTLYATTEACFATAMRIGFGDRFRG